MNLASRLRALFRRSAVERELDKELEFHLAMEAKALERTGLSPDEARTTARRSFGGLAQAKEDCRDAWGTRFLDNLSPP